MKTARSAAMLAATILATLVSGAPTSVAGEGSSARFTTGFHPRLDGVMRSLYLEGPVLDAPPGLEQAQVPVTLNLDVAIRIGTLDLGAGRHDLVVLLDPEEPWQIVPSLSVSRRKERIDLAMTEDAPWERDFGIRFVRTDRAHRLVLKAAWGDRRGTIEVVIDPESEPRAPTGVDLDDARLRPERDLLLKATGGILGTAKARGRWVALLVDLRSAALGAGRPAGVQLTEVTCELTDESLRLTAKGRTIGNDYDEVGSFRKRLAAGPLGTTFTRISVTGGDPIKGAGARVLAHPFTLVAETPPAAWSNARIDATPRPVEDGPSLTLAEEVSYLDDWLSATAGRGRGVVNIRSRVEALLDLRMVTGVSVMPNPMPLVRSPDDRLARYRVGMDVSGPFEGIVRFLDGIHAWGSPVWVGVESLRESDGGATARITFEFLSYEPLEKRDPGLRRALGPGREDQTFLDGLRSYVERLPAMPAYRRHEPVPKAEDPFRPAS